MWTNDEYLQFMYERLILMKELLSETGTIYLHCDYHRSHQLRCLMDQVFGPGNFLNEIIWQYFMGGKGKKEFAKKHDNIFVYVKNTNKYKFNKFNIKRYYDFKPSLADESANAQSGKDDIGYWGIVACPDVWQIKGVFNMGSEYLNYPTQKPEELLERIIKASSDEGDLVFDCFMGSGTTQAVALKMNRRFIGSDINLGAIQIATKRLLNIMNDTNLLNKNKAGLEVYNVNNYDFFRNPLEARDLLIEALQIQPFSQGSVFHGELDGRKVYILPVNRIATRVDLQPLTSNLPYKSYEKIQEEDPNAVVDRITLVCMGHEPDLKGSFLQMVGKFKIDIEIVDILKDKSQLEFKRDSQANIQFKHNVLTIKSFYPMNLMQKLSIQQEEVEDWTQLVDSILIDYNYDGQTLNPQILDVPSKKELVKGKYDIPKNHGRIKVKITDLLSESYEVEVVDNG